jgi:hypothetical protein
MAPSDIDFVYPVPISLSFAENRAMLPFQIGAYGKSTG